MGKEEMEEHLKRAGLKRKVAETIRSIASNKCGRVIVLEGKRIGDNGAKAVAEALKTNTTLRVIGLRWDNLGDNGAKAVAEALKTNTTLEKIILDRNNIGPEGAEAVAEALKTNTTLESIDLHSNNIGPEGAKAVAEALKTNTTLERIDLGGSNLRNNGAKAVAEALKTNTTLETIHLQSNDIGLEGAKAVAGALKTNTTLERIELFDNNIGPEGAKAVAEALKTNTTLTEIRLSDNDIGPGGAKAVAEALKTNTTLETIFLGKNNRIGLEGAKAVAEALKTNTTLKEIRLFDNDIGPEGAKAVAEALKTNTTLTSIDLGGNNIGPEGAKAIAEALDSDRKIDVKLSGDEEAAFEAAMEDKRKNPKRASQERPKPTPPPSSSAPAPKAEPKPPTLNPTIPESSARLPAKKPPQADTPGKSEGHQGQAGPHEDHRRHRAFATVQAAIQSGQCQMFGRSKVMAVGEGRKGKTTLLNSLMAKPFEEHQHSTQGSATTDLAVTVDTKEVFQWQEMKGSVSEAVRAAGSAAMAESSHMEAKWRKQAEKDRKLRQHRVKEQQEQQQKAKHKQRRRTLSQRLFTLSRAKGKKAKPAAPAPQPSTTPTPPQPLQGNAHAPASSHNDKEQQQEEQHAAPAAPISDAELEAAIKDLGLDTVMGEGKAQVTFKLFDLGGQSTFYIFHPFFLTKYAVYLLVFSMEDALSKDKETREAAWHFVEHWLTSLHLHAPGAPILMVGTFGDKVASRHQHETISKDIAKRFRTNPAFPDLAHNASNDLWFWPVNNTKSNRDPVVQDLQATISATALKQEHVQMQVPLSFLRLYDELTRQHREEDKPFLRLDEVVRVAQRFGLRDRSEVIEALQFLHLYSMVLYYDHVPGMDNVVILSPQWTVDKLCRIVRNFELHRVPMDVEACRLSRAWPDLVERGILHRKMLEVLWKDLDADLLDPLLDLMMRYGLCVHYTPPRVIGAGDARKPSTGHSGRGKSAAKDTEPAARYLVPAILGMALEGAELVNPDAKEGLSTAAAQRLHAYQGPEPKTAYLSFFLEDFKEEGSVRLEELSPRTFLPEGLFTRLLAHMMVHTQQEATSRPELSRTHARMYPGDNMLELRLVPAVGGIEVAIDSVHPRPLLNLVRDTVQQALEQHYERLGCHVLLPHSPDTLLFFDDVLYHHKDKRNIRVNRKRVTAAELAEWYGPLLPSLGLQDQYDVFLSYRQTANSGYVTAMHRALERKELGVFLDANNLETGLNFKLSFMEAIGRSLVACPVVSAGAMQRMYGLHDSDFCDNVLLEWMTMLALRKYVRSREGTTHAKIRLQRVVPLFLGSAWLDANALANVASASNSFGDIKALAQQLPDRASKETMQALNAYFEEILQLPAPEPMTVRGAVLALMDMDGRMSFPFERADADLREHAEDVRKAVEAARHKQQPQRQQGRPLSTEQGAARAAQRPAQEDKASKDDGADVDELSSELRDWLKEVSLLKKVGPALVALGVEDFEDLQDAMDMGEEFTKELRAQGAKFTHVAKLKKKVAARSP